MKLSLHFTFIFLLIAVVGIGQVEKIKTATGTFTFQQFARNIIQLKYQPNGYLTNENVSDAVIFRPLQFKSSHQISKVPFQQSIKFSSTSIDYNKGKLLFGGNKSLVLEDVFQRGEFNGFRFKLQPGEQIFGGGERAVSINRRGYKFPLYNTPWYGYSEGADALNYSVPFFTSSKGYALFFDNASRGYADIGKTNDDIFEVGFISGEMNVYIIMGKNYQEILSSYHKLTGTQPLPPRWAMGNFMSRFGYSSEQQVNEILGKMEAEDIPVDAIIFDLYWFGDSIKGTLGNLDWMNKNKWPNPKKMIEGFTKKKINSILIAEPFILKSTRTYAASQPYLAKDSIGKPYELTDFYFGRGGLLDIFRKDAGDWIWKEHYKKQISNGITGWWTDLGEPEKHPVDMMHNLADIGIKRKLKADEVHNVYGHYWNKMLFSNYANEFPEKRLFHLNRSGFAGSQRYSIFPWSGDVSRSWSGLRAQLPVMLGMSMSGVPYIHADAGGFAGGEGDNELYVRWLQFAGFTPIFRPHGTALYNLDTAAFSFPSEPALIAEPYRTYSKAVINLRYSLLPYNYTLAYRQASEGEPLVAPLYYHYPNDTIATKVEDEFMWGENILVAPVLQKGVTERKIFFPVGKWYAFSNLNTSQSDNTVYQSSTDFKTPIDAIPVFIKSGSFIPMTIRPEGVNTKTYSTDSLTVHYYAADQSSQYTLFDDDGNNNRSIRLKLFELIQFKAIPSSTEMRFIISSNGGNFAGKPFKRNIKIIVHGTTGFKNEIYVNGNQSQQLQTVLNKDGLASGNYYFTIDFSGKPVNIALKKLKIR